MDSKGEYIRFLASSNAFGRFIAKNLGDVASVRHDGVNLVFTDNIGEHVYYGTDIQSSHKEEVDISNVRFDFLKEDLLAMMEQPILFVIRKNSLQLISHY